MLEHVAGFYRAIVEPAMGKFGPENFDNQVKNNLSPQKRAHLLHLINEANRLYSPQKDQVSDEDKKYFNDHSWSQEFDGCFDANTKTEAEHSSWLWSAGKAMGDKLGVRTPYRQTREGIHTAVAILGKTIRDAAAREGKELDFVDPFLGEYTPEFALDALPGYERDAEAALAFVDEQVQDLLIGKEAQLAYAAVARRAEKLVEDLEGEATIENSDAQSYKELFNKDNVQAFAVPARNAMKKTLALAEGSDDNKVVIAGLVKLFAPFYKAVLGGDDVRLARDTIVPITIAFLLINQDQFEEFKAMIDGLNANYPKEDEFIKGNYGILFSVLDSAAERVKAYLK